MLCSMLHCCWGWEEGWGEGRNTSVHRNVCRDAVTAAPAPKAKSAQFKMSTTASSGSVVFLLWLISSPRNCDCPLIMFLLCHHFRTENAGLGGSTGDCRFVSFFATTPTSHVARRSLQSPTTGVHLDCSRVACSSPGPCHPCPYPGTLRAIRCVDAAQIDRVGNESRSGRREHTLSPTASFCVHSDCGSRTGWGLLTANVHRQGLLQMLAALSALD